MVGRQIKVELLIGTAALLLAAGGLGALIRPGLEPDRTIESRFGDVSWNHEQHARMQEIVNCQVCHHTETQGTTRPKPCRQCHRLDSDNDALILADLFMEVEKPEYSGENGPPPMKAFHGKCVGCHRAVKEGPVICRDCHTQSFSGEHGIAVWDHYSHSRKMEMECVHCHHKDTEAATDADYRPCSACHDPLVAKGLSTATELEGIGAAETMEKHRNAVHGQCDSCHNRTNPEDDLRTCMDCHGNWAYDTEKRERPTVEQAVHRRCMECHNREYDDLEASMPVTCNDCHRRDPSWLTGPELGSVLWSHKRHGMYRGVECDRCHHQDLPWEPHMACRRCHGTGLYENPSLAEALRNNCTGCHKEKDTGLTGWNLLVTEKPTLEHYRIDAEEGPLWWGHRFHAVGMSFSCQDCHHNILRTEGKYATALHVGWDWKEEAAAIQSCSNCHGDTKGGVAGSPAAGSEAPALLNAYQKVCVECHLRLEGGPQSWEEYFIEEEEGGV